MDAGGPLPSSPVLYRAAKSPAQSAAGGFRTWVSWIGRAREVSTEPCPRDHDLGPAARALLMSASTMKALMTIFVVLVGTGAARAETLVILPPSGVNVSDGILEAAGDVLRGHLVRVGRGVVVVPGAPGR